MNHVQVLSQDAWLHASQLLLTFLMSKYVIVKTSFKDNYFVIHHILYCQCHCCYRDFLYIDVQKLRKLCPLDK